MLMSWTCSTLANMREKFSTESVFVPQLFISGTAARPSHPSKRLSSDVIPETSQSFRPVTVVRSLHPMKSCASDLLVVWLTSRPVPSKLVRLV